ncbi:unnamed protein product [Paramecium sonneborni]|uniref:Uncharacterized protein n=1 Tax=Paramecium sonneborni TaxID=65129 RepID=A0A8S1N1Z1_9CILI|nr:unnamed protein product [Paramecium sonneborni]
MGICFGTKKNDRYAIIQKQINITVKEQEDMQIQEELAYQYQKQLDDEEITLKINTQPQSILNKDLNETASQQIIEQKSSNKKKRKKKHKDENYLKQIEYHITIKSIIIEEEQDQTQSQYNILMVLEYMGYSHNVQLKGVLINHPKKTFQLTPNTYEDAARHSRFSPFFQNDFYFNINADPLHNTNYFEKLLNVERTVTKDRQIRISPTKRYSKRQSSVLDEHQSPSPLKKKQNVKKSEFISELLEVVQIFDLEAQPRFLQILFALLLKEQVPQIINNFVYIEELIFLFDQLPKMEQPNIYRIAIFYETLDYNLHDLIVYMKHEEVKLSQICFLKLAHNLIQALYNCYSNHCYRINFTLSTIFYTKRTKKFKIQSFCRLQSLIPFDGDQQLNLKNVPEQKLKFFIRSFRRDFAALCDLILYMKDINKSLDEIQTLRKQAKINKSSQYLEYTETILDKEFEKSLVEVIRFSLDEIEYLRLNELLNDLKDSISILEQLIAELELKSETEKKISKENQNFQIYDKSNSDRDEYLTEIENLDLIQQMNSLPEFNKSLKQTSLKCLYKELLYSSIFMNYRFQQNCISYQQNSSDTLHAVHSHILQSFHQINYDESYYEASLLEQTKVLLPSIDQAIAHPIDRQDPFHYYVLINLLTLSQDKPFPLIIQLQRLMEAQQKIKKDQIKPKLKQNHAPGGIIEMRKAIFLQLFYTENLISRHNYSQAIHYMQRIITLLQKQNQKNSILYAYCLFLNGQLCAKTMQSISAMLNLEMCKQLYDLYFPSSLIVGDKIIESKLHQQQQNQKQENQQAKPQAMVKDVDNLSTTNQSLLEFRLGQMYSQLNDQENALKCLKRAKAIREKRFEQFSDQVIEVTLEILRVYVDQEESGAVAKLCCQLAAVMNQKYKNQESLKTKNVGILQLIMAVIYESNGVLVSSLRFYQRALRTFQASKSNNYIRQLYISDKIKGIIEKIKKIAYQTISMDKSSIDQLNNLKGFLSISDILKPYFSNSYYQNQKQGNITNQNVVSSLVYANGYLNNSELIDALTRYQAVHKIYKKQRIDECFGIVLEKLGLISIYQKKFNQGIHYLKLALEIHERYFLFPIKQCNIIKINLYILLDMALNNQQKKILDQFDVIEKFIDQIYEDVHWNLTPQIASRINKFKVMSAKIGSKALHQIQELIHYIDLYYNVKKLLYENFSDPQKLQEQAQIYLTKKLIQLCNKKRQHWIEKRTKCQIGQLAQVYIIQKRRVYSMQSCNETKKVEEQTKSRITQNSTILDFTNEKTQKNQISSVDESKETTLPNNKILIDLRSAEEIMEDQRQRQLELLQQRKLRLAQNLSQSNEYNVQNQQSQNGSFIISRQSQILQFNQMKQILQNQSQQTQESQKSILIKENQQQQQQNQSSINLQPIKVVGRQKKSLSQPGVEQDLQKNSYIKLSDEGLTNKRRRTISQQSLASIKQVKLKINPFEKSVRKK